MTGLSPKLRLLVSRNRRPSQSWMETCVSSSLLPMTRRTLDQTCSSRRFCFASLGSSIVMVTRGHTCTLLPEALQLASIRADVQQLLVVQFKVCSLIPSLFYLPIDLLFFTFVNSRCVHGLIMLFKLCVTQHSSDTSVI